MQRFNSCEELILINHVGMNDYRIKNVVVIFSIIEQCTMTTFTVCVIYCCDLYKNSTLCIVVLVKHDYEMEL